MNRHPLHKIMLLLKKNQLKVPVIMTQFLALLSMLVEIGPSTYMYII